ncbi:NadR transcriptional regulator / Nicotinamide-nucleotide adenylyltransferase, NadR family / Ribosylnicotinamide kinase [Yersinia phage fHe-Yen9-04]|uniref:NadR transcriptional regulator / Nicotinamide-nucleotide adenylyltransferase, NadR family / Ribosylnicotinamide kinase n=2 Tax=Eneladusvirus Yen904 TaxID=2560849 RepID=A0A2C9CXS6_9CAUD|nr:nicotinamide-nucleotide adenylyltransferase [Yersinia phage fHe-Yen9-04]SOK58637.1 NadR transcriptional regulator / Nicotinamide-nucleotide adenylyltransferase, NadR family / Ribosylnicotinamide kinase [Yersinia phage fHe-Yen9-04]VUE36406.1 NadR transcriptional regulator / Nicotinamide-nucleotide adenylyltransferase, NadR family / Ribosylnicotinamide kinase [Yersinia phage fHe-Yen9-04]
MNKGLFFGKFAPLTTGHVSAIAQAASKVDQLYVILCWDEKFQKTLTPDLQKILTLRNRLMWLKDTFKHLNHVNISYVDETGILSYPDGAYNFTELVRDELFNKFNCCEIETVFSSETEYNDYFKNHWPDSKHILIDPPREFVDISATRVRENPYTHWDFLAPAAHQHFVKKVCVIGVESTGKSTLTINLANHFSTQYVEEVGRTICEHEYHCSESMMNIEDYVYVAMEHKVKEHKYVKTANKLLFSDTNNLITLFSAECMGKTSVVLSQMANAEEYDLVIMLDIDVPWVYDPLRTNNTSVLRESTFEHLKFLCHAHGVKYHLISGDFDNRYKTAVKLVQQLLEGTLDECTNYES